MQIKDKLRVKFNIAFIIIIIQLVKMRKTLKKLKVAIN